MGTNCAPLLTDIFLYSYEADWIQSLLSTGKKKLSSQFNFTYRYIDDVLSINNPDFDIYLGQMYPVCWTWDQKHDREQHLCFLLGFTPVDQKGRSAAHFPLRQTLRFQLPYHKLSVYEQQHSIFASLWRFYLTTYTVYQGLLFLWMFYSKGSTTFI